MESCSEQSKERLCTLVKSLLLRRTKEQTSKTDGKPLIELTEKKFEIHKIDLTSPEKMIYDRMHKFSQRKVEDFVKNQEQKDRELVATLDIESFKEDGGIDKALAQQLEQEGGNLEDSLSEIVTHQASQIEDLFERTYASTKIKAVMDGVDSITNKNETGAMDKCVIVSQWTQLLDIVEYHLKARGVGITRIDGSVPPATRQERVDRFNKKNRGSAVMLLSLTAGGVGLNLVGGNHLFLVDLHWNPALEQQAFDRIYRMGQEKDVFVHKFVCNETIEQRILDIQEEKLQLARDVLQGGAIKNLSRLTLRDFKYLFNLEKDPREIAAAENRVLKPQQAYLPQQKCSSSGAFSSHVFH